MHLIMDKWSTGPNLHENPDMSPSPRLTPPGSIRSKLSIGSSPEMRFGSYRFEDQEVSAKIDGLVTKPELKCKTFDVVSDS